MKKIFTLTLPLFLLVSCGGSAPYVEEKVDSETLYHNVENMDNYSIKTSYSASTTYLENNKVYHLSMTTSDGYTFVTGDNYLSKYYRTVKYSNPLSSSEAKWKKSVEQYFQEVKDSDPHYQSLKLEVDRVNDIYTVEMPFFLYDDYYVYQYDTKQYQAYRYANGEFIRNITSSTPTNKFNNGVHSIKSIFLSCIDNGHYESNKITYNLSKFEQQDYLANVGENTNYVPTSITLTIKNNQIQYVDTYYDLERINAKKDSSVSYIPLPGEYTEYVAHSEYYDYGTTSIDWPKGVKVNKAPVEVKGKTFKFKDMELVLSADNDEDRNRIQSGYEQYKATYKDGLLIFKNDDTFSMTTVEYEVLGSYSQIDAEVTMNTTKVIQGGEESEFNNFRLDGFVNGDTIKVYLGGGGGAGSQGSYSFGYYAIFELGK